MENIKEPTEIRVALCSDGIISFRITSVFTSRKSSASAPRNPPAIIIKTFPVRAAARAHPTPKALSISSFLVSAK